MQVRGTKGIKVMQRYHAGHICRHTVFENRSVLAERPQSRTRLRQLFEFSDKFVEHAHKNRCRAVRCHRREVDNVRVQNAEQSASNIVTVSSFKPIEHRYKQVTELEDIISNLLNTAALWMRLNIILRTESLTSAIIIMPYC